MADRRFPTGRGRALAGAALLALATGWGVSAIVRPAPAADGGLGQAGAGGEAQAAYRRGLAALARGDARTARIELMNATRADPRSAAVRIAQARALLLLDNGAGAQAELDQAARLGAAPGAMRPWLAWALLAQGRAADALAQATAADGRPEDALVLARMEGRAQQALGRLDAAAAAFARAGRLAPDDAALWIDLARFRFASGDLAGAIGASERAVRLAPASAEALTVRGLMAREQYGLAGATGWFRAALGRDPNYGPALIEQAATLADMGQASPALALTRRALALSPGLPRAYFVQALIAARAGDYDLARALLDHTRGALDGQAATRLLRGALQLQAGNGALAVGQLEPLLAAQPLNLRARLLLARAYADAGQYADAERTLFPLAERADAGSYVLTLAARVNEALGNRPVADGFLARAATGSVGRAEVFRGAGAPAQAAPAADADPTAAAPNLRYIRALLEAGQGDAALARARMLAGANGGAPGAWIVLGDCLAAQGRFAEAAAAYERAGNIRFDRDVALRLIDAQRRSGRAGAARRTLGLLVASYPMEVDGQRLAAAGWLAEGRYAQALGLLEGVRQRLGNEDWLLMVDMAQAYLGLGRPEAALPFAAHAYRLQPGGAVAADMFGWALFAADGPVPAARELLEKAAMLAPGEPLVQWHLGRLLAAAGENAKARIALRKAASVAGFPQRAAALAALRAL